MTTATDAILALVVDLRLEHARHRKAVAAMQYQLDELTAKIDRATAGIGRPITIDHAINALEQASDNWEAYSAEDHANDIYAANFHAMDDLQEVLIDATTTF